MGITTEDIMIPAKGGGSFKAYVAMPEKLPAPTVVVIQEIFGINQVMRDKCKWLAEEGYIAVCPDLFWRIEPGIELTDKTEEEWQQAFDLFGKFNVDLGVEDLRATEHTFKGHAHSTGRVGCLGYCLGGKLAYLMATRTGVDASVGYYGVGLNELLDEAKNISKPLMLHIAEEDGFVDKEAQAQIKEGLKDIPQVTMHSYPGLDHAFSREGGQHYDAEGAKLANERSLQFLANALGLKKS
ncbi:MAG TPA: dienelactone hydrolase family protein [Micavibrio sp.]|nr:dienelactone hydrolase family protein [Pseudomonadota bacterium]MEC8664965.1 dienelactone hydrolase family protein [Pseudomonadota bacterium]HIF25346.1 dienelactone hydrolase family protein [Micavibrio sp.]HIL29414.1 dienelactone hydrolase family protein [Micavibrio sp.]